MKRNKSLKQVEASTSLNEKINNLKSDLERTDENLLIKDEEIESFKSGLKNKEKVLSSLQIQHARQKIHHKAEIEKQQAEIEKKETEIKMLIGMIIRFEEIFLTSRRWKIVKSLGYLWETITPWRRRPVESDKPEDILDEFHNWRKDRFSGTGEKRK